MYYTLKCIEGLMRKVVVSSSFDGEGSLDAGSGLSFRCRTYANSYAHTYKLYSRSPLS